MGEIYDLAAARNSTIVGGDDSDVGLGGYITGGGGHSPLSGQYGLAADNVLEFEVVTPSGETKILNECSNTDLYFAFRGVRSFLFSACSYHDGQKLIFYREEVRLLASSFQQLSKPFPYPPYHGPTSRYLRRRQTIPPSGKPQPTSIPSSPASFEAE